MIYQRNKLLHTIMSTHHSLWKSTA